MPADQTSQRAGAVTPNSRSMSGNVSKGVEKPLIRRLSGGVAPRPAGESAEGLPVERLRILCKRPGTAGSVATRRRRRHDTTAPPQSGFKTIQTPTDFDQLALQIQQELLTALQRETSTIAGLHLHRAFPAEHFELLVRELQETVVPESRRWPNAF